MTAEATESSATTPPHPAEIPWGLRDRVPSGARIAWGARAIYRLDHTPARYRSTGLRSRAKLVSRSTTTASIDLLWDRQGIGVLPDVTDRERKAFETWLNGKGLPALRKACAKQYVTGDSEDFVEVERDGYKIVASPRASYGYLYIVAWKQP